MGKEKEIIIVSGGYINTDLLSVLISKKESFVIGVDKGLEALRRLGVEADFAIGDFDSADKDIKSFYADRENVLFLNSEKDFTDTHVAVLEALKKKPDTITIVGATGGRLDHFLANLSLLHICENKDVQAFLLDEKNRIRITKKPMSIKKICQYGDYVSLVPFTDKVTRVTLTGFKYKLTDYNLVKEETIGISNQIEREEGFIDFESGELIVIESKD